MGHPTRGWVGFSGGFKAVYQRYWSRMLVIQEFLLAKECTVYFGHDTIPADILESAQNITRDLFSKQIARLRAPRRYG
jgi:hypothetical protein